MVLIGSPAQVLAICSTARSKSRQLRWRIGGRDGAPSWALPIAVGGLVPLLSQLLQPLPAFPPHSHNLAEPHSDNLLSMFLLS